MAATAGRITVALELTDSRPSHLVLREGQSPAVGAMVTDIVETQQAPLTRMYTRDLDWVHRT